MSKTVKTNLVLDFVNPNKEMLMREGETPISAVVAITPDPSELALAALEKINKALSMYMEPEKILLLEREAIELTSGKIIELGSHSIFFSLSYPTADGRIFEMELGAPASATLH